jgi:hypothetical protein
MKFITPGNGGSVLFEQARDGRMIASRTANNRHGRLLCRKDQLLDPRRHHAQNLRRILRLTGGRFHLDG